MGPSIQFPKHERGGILYLVSKSGSERWMFLNICEVYMDIEKIFYSYFVQYFLILSSGMVREFPFQIWDENLSKWLGYRFLKITHWWNVTVYSSKRIVRIFIKIYLKIFLLSCFKNLRAIGFEVLEVEISNLCRSDPYLDHIKFGRRDFVLKFLQIRFFFNSSYDRHPRFHSYFDLKM